MNLLKTIETSTTPLEIYLLIGLPAWVVLCSGLVAALRQLKLVSDDAEKSVAPLLRWMNIVASIAALFSLLLLVGKAAPLFVVIILILLAAVVAVFAGITTYRAFKSTNKD